MEVISSFVKPIREANFPLLESFQVLVLSITQSVATINWITFAAYDKCDWICEKGSYMCNYEYLETHTTLKYSIQYN